MPSNEQRRQAAKRKLERQLARRAERVRRRRRIAVAGTVAVVVLGIGGAYFLTTQGHGDSSAAAAPSTAPNAPKTSGGPCTYTETPGEPAAKPAGLPEDPAQTPNRGTVAVTLKTDQGDVPLTLDRAAAPCTVQSFVHLAKQRYYDGSPCHRLTTKDPLKVLQCGDPTGQGSGGPGYTVKDEKPTNLRPAPNGQGSLYPRGTLAMANTGQPNSGGSQFFMVYADSTLPPDYTVFGTISPEGLKVLDKIAAAGDDGAFESSAGGGKPKLPTTIQQAVVAN